MSNIKAIRTRLGLTQVALAKGIGCTQGNIGHYENKGQTMPPDVARRLIGCAKSLGQDISFDDIYADSSGSLQAQAGQLCPVLDVGDVAPPTVAVPAGMALIPERRVAIEQRRAVDRKRDIAQTGQGV